MSIKQDVRELFKIAKYEIGLTVLGLILWGISAARGENTFGPKLTPLAVAGDIAFGVGIYGIAARRALHKLEP